MRAIVAEVHGGPDVLRLEEIERPGIADTDVLLRACAAGSNAGTGT